MKRRAIPPDLDHFDEMVYQTLRKYQRGEFDATSGVVAGRLDIPLTAVLDAVKQAARKLVMVAGGRP